MIKTKNIVQQTLKAELGGFEKISKLGEQKKAKLSAKRMKDIEDSKISLDEYIAMEQFAQFLPRGKRKLRLNLPELRKELLSNQKANAMTDVQGLRSGGLASKVGNNKAPANRSTKLIKELNQSDMLFTIKNKNRLKSRVNDKQSFNPNYTSFKNNFKIS